MKQISEIWLCMENCDVVKLPPESVSLLEIDGVSALSGDTPQNTGYPDIKVIFRIKYEYMAYFDGTAEDMEFYSYIFSTENLNIVSVDIHFSDGSVTEYRVPWEDGAFDTENALETLTRLPDGQVMIEIKNP
ncbi:MAG: hypothetical protein E7389_01305 [Ruminococcaceae bacterium]|nr:hypothetical protein [Oscillospiraceae bacterium]